MPLTRPAPSKPITLTQWAHLLGDINKCAEAFLCHQWTAFLDHFLSTTLLFGEICLPGDLNECAKDSLYALSNTTFHESLSYWLYKLCLLGGPEWKYRDFNCVTNGQIFEDPSFKYNSIDSMSSVSQETWMNVQRLPYIPLTRPPSK